MVAISKIHATCAHLDTHHTFALFSHAERTEILNKSDFIYFVAKLKAYEYMRRRSQKKSFNYQDFVNVENKFYQEELEFQKKLKGANK